MNFISCLCSVKICLYCSGQRQNTSCLSEPVPFNPAFSNAWETWPLPGRGVVAEDLERAGIRKVVRRDKGRWLQSLTFKIPIPFPMQAKYLCLGIPCWGGCRVAALSADGLARVTATLSFLSCVKGISLCQGPSCAPTVVLLYLWAEQAKVTC